ncbi:hypothetical protein MINS_34330 [Mycolicibacterium insubricum]|nr:hypothetical protein MINS_34330 [Mycolicibacterium insubricum]
MIMSNFNLKPRIVLRAAPLLVAGAVVSAVSAAPFAAASFTEANLLPGTITTTHSSIEFPLDPGGGGCVGDHCGSGGTDSGPGGGAGGQGCVPTAGGTACGSGGVNGGPGGVPGGQGCIPGVGCGSGHG